MTPLSPHPSLFFPVGKERAGPVGQPLYPQVGKKRAGAPEMRSDGQQLIDHQPLQMTMQEDMKPAEGLVPHPPLQTSLAPLILSQRLPEAMLAVAMWQRWQMPALPIANTPRPSERSQACQHWL